MGKMTDMTGIGLGWIDLSCYQIESLSLDLIAQNLIATKLFMLCLTETRAHVRLHRAGYS